MKLEKTLLTLRVNQSASQNESLIGGINCRTLLITTVIYLVCVLSLPLIQLERIIWYAAYPIIMAPLIGRAYSRIFIKALIVLPFIIFIGIFNPILDHTTAFYIGNIPISIGWITLISIIIRGLLCMQALLILVHFSGFYRVCETLGYFGAPKIMVMQLVMLHRYAVVTMEEALKMYRSVISRGYGKSSFPLKMWAKFMGSIFFNSIDRSKRIHRAMKARGFDGEIYLSEPSKWKIQDLYFLVTWVIIFLLLHFVNISQIFFSNL